MGKVIEMPYIRVGKLEEATHWIALEDPRYIWGDFTVNHLYEIKQRKCEIQNMWEQNIISKEYYILDDEEKPFCEVWNIRKGYFVKML